nr:arabinan endo-1,5-alpha-L-arabinosidase [Melissococcus plutonius]
MITTDGVHDPTIIEENGKFYLFSTDTQQPPTTGVPIRTSVDLVHWKFEKSAMKDVPKQAKEWSGAKGLWAPEIIYMNGEYRMYYSASTFGSTTSLIGLASAPHPLGPWKDQGTVIKTNKDLANHNAIDANICLDHKGNPWLVYGSFFGGIYITQINLKTGKLMRKDYGTKIAERLQIVDNAIEGPFIYYNPKTKYYYLFVSFDSLSNSYNIRVARSKEITGPYVDMNGYQMINLTEQPEKIGVKLLGSYQFRQEAPVFAPGHNSIFKRNDGILFMVHHIRKKPFTEEFALNIRRLFWLENGWPVVSASCFAGEVARQPKQEELMGNWEIVQFENHSDRILSREIYLNKVTRLEHSYLVNDQEFIPYYEMKTNQPTLYLSGLDKNGRAFIAKKMK